MHCETLTGVMYMTGRPSWPPGEHGLVNSSQCDVLGEGKDDRRHHEDGLPVIVLECIF